MNYEVKPMNYTPDYIVDILAGSDFDYFPYKYLVVNYGTHPCCYVGIPDTMRVVPDELWCHGGVTWTSEKLPSSLKKIVEEDFLENTWWIGWDYRHSGDFYYIRSEDVIINSGKQWTTEEMVQDCKDMIEQLMNLERNEE